jgi:hypothetical protein
MKRRWTALLLAAGLSMFSAGAANPKVSRDTLKALEEKFDRRIQSYDINDPFELLGNTRGVYLEDYGAVFTSEVNLVAAAVVTPFRPSFTKEQIEQLRLKKASRVEEIKKLMQAMMVDSALALPAVPPQQKIAVGVSLFRFSWEDSRGVPAQIVMEAPRQALVDAESGRLDAAGLRAATRVTEF